MANVDGEEKDRTLYCGNVHPDVTEEMLYELFLQAGPLEKVKIVTNRNYAFITFKHAISVPYTIQLMKGIRLYQRPLLLQTRTGANSDLNQASLPNLSYPSPTVSSPYNLNGSKFLQTPAATLSSMPKVVPVNTPFHRSVSQPNVALNHKPYSDSHRNETDFLHRGPVKTKLALHHPSHRANLPYSRTSTPDPRLNEIKRNDALKPHVLVSSPIYFHGNMPSAVYWQNQQLTAQRRF